MRHAACGMRLAAGTPAAREAELFERTLKFMRRDADLLQAEQAELVQERQP
jgi:hypothetical protein